MSIMQELKKRCRSDECPGIRCEDCLKNWLPVAVDRERNDLLDEIKILHMEEKWKGFHSIEELRDKHSLSQYCKGMQKAIKEKKVFEYMQRTFYVYMTYGNEQIFRCPFCPNGENCINR